MPKALLALLALLLCLPMAAQALEFDIGGGAKIDIAPYGVENVTALILAAPWFEIAKGLEAGILTAGSAGPAKIDLEASACLRVRPLGGAFALFDGAGALVENDLWPEVIPMVLGGIRVGAGPDAFVASIEMHYKRTDTDTMVWVAYTRQL